MKKGEGAFLGGSSSKGVWRRMYVKNPVRSERTGVEGETEQRSNSGERYKKRASTRWKRHEPGEEGKLGGRIGTVI